MATLRCDILTIFPGMFDSVLGASLLGKARARGLLDIRVHDLRRWAAPPHHVTDDAAYGGGPGMVMKPEPIVAAVEELRGATGWTVLLAPQGERLTQARVHALAQRAHLILICGRYEGVDDRVRPLVVDQEVSLGDYVLSGGEIAALAVIDAVSRLVPGVVGSAASLEDESHTAGLLEYPQYTRPEVFRGLAVPPVLLSGHHARVRRWRRAQALRRTLAQRPDYLQPEALGVEDRALLAEFPASPEDAPPLSTERQAETMSAEGPADGTS